VYAYLSSLLLLARVGNCYSGAEQYSGHRALKQDENIDPQNGQQMVAIVTFVRYNFST
jgi:hypothetical protein